jgi:hypothetical protein
MSVYDSTPSGATAAPAKPAPQTDANRPPSKQRGCGCGSCLLGCLTITLLFVAAILVGGWFALQRLPDWSREALVEVINDSQLPADQKQEIVQQIDRVHAAYKNGDVGVEQFETMAEEFASSPLFGLVIASAAAEKYVKPSGLELEEKLTAQVTLQRITRGVHEETIPYEDVEPALDYISVEDANGNREFRESVSDEDLRAMLAECKRLADEADIPLDVLEINIAEEIKKIVDQALSPSV